MGAQWATEFEMRPPVTVRNIPDMDLVEICLEIRTGIVQKMILTRKEAIFLEGVLRGARRERESKRK
jgi:hypothetical protein